MSTERRAELQWGLLTYAQARGSGLSPQQIQRRVASGRWRQVRHGVFAVAGVPPSWEQCVMAAVLAAGDGAVASHFTAGALVGTPELRSGVPGGQHRPSAPAPLGRCPHTPHQTISPRGTHRHPWHPGHVTRADVGRQFWAPLGCPTGRRNRRRDPTQDPPTRGAPSLRSGPASRARAASEEDPSRPRACASPATTPGRAGSRCVSRGVWSHTGVLSL